METLVELQQDFSKRAFFKSHLYYRDYRVDLLESPEYKKIALEVKRELVVMPTTYISEKGFSCLVELKTKKQNTLKCVDSLISRALEELIHPQFEKLLKKFRSIPVTNEH